MIHVPQMGNLMGDDIGQDGPGRTDKPPVERKIAVRRTTPPATGLVADSDPPVFQAMVGCHLVDVEPDFFPGPTLEEIPDPPWQMTRVAPNHQVPAIDARGSACIRIMPNPKIAPEIGQRAAIHKRLTLWQLTNSGDQPVTVFVNEPLHQASSGPWRDGKHSRIILGIDPQGHAPRPWMASDLHPYYPFIRFNCQGFLTLGHALAG